MTDSDIGDRQRARRYIIAAVIMGKSAMTPQAMTQAARSLRRFPTTRARLAPPSYSSTRDVTPTRNLAAGTRTILLLEHVQFRWKLIML